MRLLQPLHVHLSTLFFTLTLLVGCLIGGLGYYMSASMVQTAASEQWERMGQSVQQELRNTLEPAEMALQFLRVHRITLADSLPQRAVKRRPAAVVVSRSATITRLTGAASTLEATRV